MLLILRLFGNLLNPSFAKKLQLQNNYFGRPRFDFKQK